MSQKAEKTLFLFSSFSVVIPPEHEVSTPNLAEFQMERTAFLRREFNNSVITCSYGGEREKTVRGGLEKRANAREKAVTEGI